MLQNLFPAIPVEQEGTAGAGPSANESIPTARAETVEEQILNNDSLEDIENEDELVDRMLVQFPVYGAKTPINVSIGSTNLNQTADWLLGGTSNIPNQQQLKQQQERKEESEYFSSSLPTPGDKSPTSGTKSKKYLGWDEEEQQLWMKETKVQQSSKKKNVETTSDTNRTSSFRVGPNGERPQLKDPSKDWLMAYYYHTGVNPKFETPPSLKRTSKPTFQSKNKSMSVAIHHIPEDDDQDEVNSEAIQTPSSTKQIINTIVMESGLTAPTIDDDRQHWMPDRLCKQCYACDSPFTVFRRRHHCRICGQVFCNTCSGYFVPATSKQELQQQQEEVWSQQQPPNSTSALSNTNNKTILRTCKMCYEQVADQQQLTDGEEMKSDEPYGSPTQDDRKQDRRQISDTPRAGTVPSTPLLQTQLESGDSVLKDLSQKRIESPYAQRRLLSQQQAIEEEEKEQTSLILQEQQAEEKLQLHHETTSSRLGLSPPNYGGSNIKHGQLLHNSSSDVLKSRDVDKEFSQSIEDGKRHLGLTAASHLEQMLEELLESDAPLLWQDLTNKRENGEDPNLLKKWINELMTLATKSVALVEPNVKRGDSLDIRPYVKIKVIPGGSYDDCAYLSGILFRKTVSHKQMAREINRPRIMLLSGGIEFTRTENRIASLDTLLEQEGKYTEILVRKILKLKPDVLMVGKAVSRRAQELLLRANVVLIQHVKASLMNRISRQTGATIITSTSHVMNQFGTHVLGKCHRFRIVVARDNEVWKDDTTNLTSQRSGIRDIKKLLQDPKLSNHERQEVLAAERLGESIMDGAEAVKSGLAKRGVAQTYVMLEGCPKHLGCTVVLRGASRRALKQIKLVFRFLVNSAYNLRLETSFFKERNARLRPDYEIQKENLFSSSLCINYGAPTNSRKNRPWNGGSNNESTLRSLSGEITAYDHQSILISSVWMTGKTQCCPAEVKGICYYSKQDVSLGQFLRDSCFNMSLKCQNSSCKKSVLDHSLSFVHNDGFINITVDNMDEPLPPPPFDSTRSRSRGSRNDEDSEVQDNPIATWTYCKNCCKVVTPLVYISEDSWKYSFGKFLESFFYNRDTIMNSSQSNCTCPLQTHGNLFFGCGSLAARFTYEQVRPFNVSVRKSLPIDAFFHRTEALRQLEKISSASSLLFAKFDKHIEKVSREARAIFDKSSSLPDHLDTVLNELNKISSEVDHAAKTLQEKIVSVSEKYSGEGAVVGDALFRFPWFARRYLYMLTSTWNEKLSAAGQAIVAIKKLSSSASQRNDGVAAISSDQTEELNEGIKRLRQLRDVYSRYNVTDITTVVPMIPGNAESKAGEYDDDFEDGEAYDFTDSIDADVIASRRRLQNNDEKQSKTRGQETIPNANVSVKVNPGGAVKSAITRFFNRGGQESDPYTVDLGIFSKGRPRLEPGVNGIVLPVMDEQMSTIIAYSLSSTEYAKQFETYSKFEDLKSDPASTSGIPPDSPSGSMTDNGMPQVGRNAFKDSQNSRTPSNQASQSGIRDKEGIERRLLIRNKSHVKHVFRDFDEKGQNVCKFTCTSYWATQFCAVREAFLSPNKDKDESFGETSLTVEQAYVQSLISSYAWAASGGKSGASFARTADDRFVIKHISKTELQMFLDCAPAYFEYLSKVFFHGL